MLASRHSNGASLMTASERELRNRADHYGWRIQRRGTGWLLYNGRPADGGARYVVATLAEVEAILDADAEKMID